MKISALDVVISAAILVVYFVVFGTAASWFPKLPGLRWVFEESAKIWPWVS